MRDTFWRLLIWLLGKGRIERYAAWVRFEVCGPTGYGRGPEWMRPAFPKPWVPRFVARKLRETAEHSTRQCSATHSPPRALKCLASIRDDWR